MSETRLLACPRCNALNRLPAGRLHDDGRCGRCKEALFKKAPVHLTAGNFAAHAERSEIPLLIDFWAPWCGPCRSMEPAFAAAAGLLEPEIRLGKLNTEEEQALAGRFGIRSIPTLLLLHQGREIARQTGAMNAEDIRRWALAQWKKR